MLYRKSWDLSSVPDRLIRAEAGRRIPRGSARPPKLEPCPKCGRVLSARERRLKCPEHLRH